MAEINYTITKSKDTFTLTNNEASSVDYVMKDIDPCTSDDVIYTGQLLSGESKLIDFPTDGTYELTLTSVVTASNQSVIIFKSYLNLQLSMVEDIFTSLCPCDCGCDDCADLTVKGCEALLATRTKIDVFKYMSAPRYDAFFTEVHKSTSCLVLPELYCDISMENISGITQYNENLQKQLIALDYLAMYFSELKGLTETEEIQYIKEKYQAESVLCCINKLGIDIKEIETTINNMATITMNAGAYTNLPPDVVGDNTLATPNRTPYIYSMADFTNNTTPPYNDPEGDAADAVRVDTLPQDGELQLNGAPISAGTIISKTDIDNNLFAFVPPNQDPSDADTWTFSVRDEGSGQFSS